MIKNKVLYLYDLKNKADLERYDVNIQLAIDKLCEDGHLFVSINTVSMGREGGGGSNLRTQITYQENITRKTIVEKK